MKVIFRVDASLQMGTGHVMRCLTLAQVLKEDGVNTEFICRKHKGNLIDKIRLSGFHTHELELSDESETDNKLAHSSWLGVTQQKDSDDCIDILKIEKTDCLIVDHYGLDEQWQKSLKPYYEKLLVIDDLADRKFDCDVLLNQNLGSHKDDYKNKVPKGCELLLGCKYALLRPEFLKLRDQALEKRKSTKVIKNILVSMGGGENNITYDILQQLDDRFNVVVVLGKNSPCNEMVQRYAQGKNIKVIVEADNMGRLMLEADLAIGAGGSTSWERCCLGLPTILYMTAENQREVVKNLEKLGAVIMAESLKDDLQLIMSDFSLWQGMSNKAQAICDGLGVKRIKI
jgi:UDP-2,4-diacetamido-2,4,6-trideoxy-beta-L-altropyranose hydrolase